MRNCHLKHPGLTAPRLRHILRLFGPDLAASGTARPGGVSVRSVNEV